MPNEKKSAKETNLNFEDAVLRLEKIVTELEDGELSLEKSLSSFEEGMQLAKVCESKLNAASGRVEKIMRDFSGAEKRVALTDAEFLDDDEKTDADADDSDEDEDL